MRSLFMLLLLGMPLIAAEPERAGPDWWSLQPLHAPPIPPLTDAAIRNPIDAFVLASLQAKGLMLAPETDRRTLIRRLTFDLTGLPPTPTEVEAFLADTAPDAYERVVDRLLASPRYGERWARHWLDLVRYSESDGYERDQPRDFVWPYRDYVIRSFNEDKPYGQFVREQIAGDVLGTPTREGIIATGFLTCGPYDVVGATAGSPSVKGKARQDELEEMLAVVGQTFLGLTINCARCHDHKFDPISHRDYYRFQAIFAGVSPGVRDLPVAPGQPAKTYAGVRFAPPEVQILKRGEWNRPEGIVTPGGLSVLPGAEWKLAANAPEGARRARLAEWLTDAKQPLTWRVMVNRLWQHHFGRGLVGSSSDFGLNGERPTHPELLDWLAVQLRDGDQRLKPLHRLMVTSRTYRQSSRFDAKAAQLDAEGRGLWRYTPRRLEGEAVRDAMLALSGELNPQMEGPSYRPFRITVFNATFYEVIEEDRPELLRRSIYRMEVQSARDPLLDSLDCPEPSTKTPRRSATTTPLQSLGLMNGGFVQRQSRLFAEQLQRASGDVAQQVRQLYERAYGRGPTPMEQAASEQLVKEHGLRELVWVILNSSEFLYLR